MKGVQHPGRGLVLGKVCRLCNRSAAALWVWGPQAPSIALFSRLCVAFGLHCMCKSVDYQASKPVRLQ